MVFGYAKKPIMDTHFFEFYFDDDTRKNGKLVIHSVEMSGEAALRMAAFIQEHFALDKDQD